MDPISILVLHMATSSVSLSPVKGNTVCGSCRSHQKAMAKLGPGGFGHSPDNFSDHL